MKVLCAQVSVATMVVMALATGSAARAEVRVVNNDNKVLWAAAGHHVAGGKVDYNGWTRVDPGQSVVVYSGSEARIILAVKNDGEQDSRNINNNQGVRDYLVTDDRFDVLDEGGPARLERLRWGPNLEFMFFKDNNNNAPDGWYSRRFYIVPNHVNQVFIP